MEPLYNRSGWVNESQKSEQEVTAAPNTEIDFERDFGGKDLEE